MTQNLSKKYYRSIETKNSLPFGTSSRPKAVTNFIQRFNDELADFMESLASERFWHVCPLGSKEPCGLFDTKTGLQHPPISTYQEFFNTNPFFLVTDKQEHHVIFDTKQKLLWSWGKSSNLIQGNLDKLNIAAAKFRILGLNGWNVPKMLDFKKFAQNKANPEIIGNRILNHFAWMTQENLIDLDNWTISSTQHTGFLIVNNSAWYSITFAEIVASIGENSYKLSSANKQKTIHPSIDTSWQNFSHEQLLLTLNEQSCYLRGVNQQNSLVNPITILSNLDWRSCRLPQLEKARLTDLNKGLWELWGCEPAGLAKLKLVARNPKQDVKLHNVAIDFGTSSTVVAYCDQHGARQLLRIGVRDFYQQPEATHYENPTVLEILDFERFRAIWQRQTYRPELDWNWLHTSHEAQENFRNNPGDTRVLARILPRIKQWAMRSEKQQLQLTDYQGYEFTLAALTERNPVRGQPMEVSDTDPFDPVELYAWYLGMTINWRERGLYLKYHLTFPAKYERATKDKILASFRRGLQRSLPSTLVSQNEVFRDFEVKELASEPAAYAAAALHHLASQDAVDTSTVINGNSRSIKPKLTEDGVAYAVFDFGGGTTDFDFGLWRWATADEEDEGYEQVFESLHSSGDNFLGGENLLEHLVYETFKDNLDICREHKIPFTRPLDGKSFSGDEVFVQQTQAAQTNSVLLGTKLRPFMENADSQLQSQASIDLLNMDGQKVKSEISFDVQKLDVLLFNRIKEGLRAFLVELDHVVEQLGPRPIHLLLAGNGSRSRYITALVENESDEWDALLEEVFQGRSPTLVIHPPLAVNQDNLHAPTAKTGVALGLLRLCPGEKVKLINKIRTESHDEAPFRYYLGGIRRGQFTPQLAPFSDYQQWQLLGSMPQQVFKLCYSVSPKAKVGMQEGDPELLIHRLDFPAAPSGTKLFVRAIHPCIVELAAVSEEALLESDIISRMKLDLETGLITS
ncbi:acetate and sugar kinases/Hsc70/actin family protein [Shewanella xiamenensis]|uniref:hypothetical protein n=1 Tax=Shewanella xiamenensis TaxID=332186 RepID=UPI001C4EF195|nr:hypothetical protein [Shewanella xiamenensis]MBW0281477.1 hypothetical protein [Shewanella xiamenensis]MCT8872150.1 hypothetical protein [Shewanella xiamenensis]UWH40057.1 hypothetical protein KXJ80_12015 [Shewanella xiamenensis]